MVLFELIILVLYENANSDYFYHTRVFSVLKSTELIVFNTYCHLDEIWDVIVSVSEGFLTYSSGLSDQSPLSQLYSVLFCALATKSQSEIHQTVED